MKGLPPRLLAPFVAAVAAVAVLGAPADGAQAASVTPQAVFTAPTRVPVDLPGRRYRKGMVVPTRHTLVVRRVTLDPRESLDVTMSCDVDRRIASFGFREEFPFGFRIATGQSPSYYGKRRVRLTFFWVARFSPDRRASGSIYLLCRPR